MQREAFSTRLQRYSKEKRYRKETAQQELKETIQTYNQIIFQHVCYFYSCLLWGAVNPKFLISIVRWLDPLRRSVMQEHLSSPSLFCSLPWIPYPHRHRSTGPRCPPQRPSQARRQQHHTRRARSSAEDTGWSMMRPAASWRSWGTKWRSLCWLWSCWRLSKCNKTCFEHWLH